MIKNLFIVGAFCSLSFGGIADDIQKDQQIDPKIENINNFIDKSIAECKAINFYESDSLSLEDLEKLYDSSDSVIDNVKKINEKYKEEMSKFYRSYTYEAFGKIHELIHGRNHWNDYQVLTRKIGGVEDICPQIRDIESYKQSLKNEYLAQKKKIGKEKNEIQIKQILEDEKWQWNNQDTTTIEQYDTFISNAHALFEKLRQLSTPYKIDTYEYNSEAEERYINDLKDYRQRKIDEIARKKQNELQDKKYAENKKALIPKYKKWKATIPKFQKNLKVGDYVAGGIVWKVNGNLVVIDAGQRGLISQRRDETLPKVPQDLMPLFMDEISGIATY